jgi:hypothetical protein
MYAKRAEKILVEILLSAKTPVGMIGAIKLLSLKMNAMNDTMIMTSSRIKSGNSTIEPATETANIRVNRNVRKSIAPMVSNLVSCTRSVSGIVAHTTMNPIMPIGRLIRKILSHPKNWLRMPPKTGPSANAPARTTEFSPIALPRF